MRRSFLLLVLLAAFLAGMAGRTFAQSAPDKPIDVTSMIGKDEPANAAEDLAPGDHKRFHFSTSTDITLLKIGDVYTTDGIGDKALYKVVEIPSQGSGGGTVVFERTSGNMGDIPDKLKRQDSGQPSTLAKKVTLFDLYLQGGVFLHPIALLGIITILLAVNSLWIYRYGRQIPASFVAASRAALKAGDVKKFRQLALTTPGLLPAICRGLTDRFNSSSIEEIKSRTEVHANAQVHRLRLPIKVLNLISVAAPLLGLLGTIVGMVIVFEAVGNATGAAKATALAAGIRVKLFSTAMALIVAIPSLFLYFIFNARLGGIIAQCEIIVEGFMHSLSLIKRADAGDQTVAVEEMEDDQEEADEDPDAASEDEDDEPIIIKKRTVKKA